MTAGPAGKWRLWRMDATGTAVCAVVSLMAYFLVVGPVVSRQAGLASLRSDIARKQNLTAQLDQEQGLLTDQVKLMRQQLATSQLQLQPPRYLNTRMALIIELASTSGIVIGETRSGDVKAHQLYQTVPIQLTGTGSYPHCAAFLHQLHQTFPGTGVVAFELSGNPGHPTAPAGFRFDLIWFAAPTLAAAPD